MNRYDFWKGLEATGYPFEITVAQELQNAGWDFIIDYPVSVLPDPSYLPVSESSIDFKAWHGSLFALIEARRAAHGEWVLFRKTVERRFFLLSHHEMSNRRPGYEFPLQWSITEGRSGTHCQSVNGFQSDIDVYSNAISVNSRGHSKDGNEDQRTKKSEIRKGAKQASIATIGVMNDDYAFMKDPQSKIYPDGRLYIPVITTAAEISTLDILPSQINKHGSIPDWRSMDCKKVQWAIYRYSLPRSLWLPIASPHNAINDHRLLEKHRKLDIFIVNHMHLEEFLAEIEDIVK